MNNARPRLGAAIGLLFIGVSGAAGFSAIAEANGPTKVVTSPEAWQQLLRVYGAPNAMMSLLCTATIVGCVWVGALGALSALCQLLRFRWLSVIVTRLTPRLLRPALGLITLAACVAPRPVAAADDRANAPVMVRVESSASPASPPPTMYRVNAPAPATVVAMTLPDWASGVTETAPTPATWTIQPGEHLWHVAEATLTETYGRPPSGRETTRYWRAVIAANLDRLIDRSNPDLVLPGQVFTLPPS